MHIVIINNKFPPNQGIGGRRMALLAKYLLEKGHIVSVICQKPYSIHPSNEQWLSKEEQEKINYVFIKNKNYLNQSIFSNHFIAKLLTLLLRILFKILNKGNIYDSALFQQNDVIAALVYFQQKQPIDWVIASAAPFNLLYYAALFKKRFPKVKLCCDIRDPWLKNDNYGYQTLSTSRKEFEKDKMKFILEHAHIITSPHPSCLKEISELGNAPEKFKLIEHCFETSIINKDFQPTENPPKTEEHKINFVYAGTIYPKCEAYFQQLNSQLHIIQHDQPKLYNRLSISVYSDDCHKMQPNLKDHPIHFSPAIGKAISTPLMETDYIIIMVNESMKDLFITKVFDYSVYEKPYAFIGPKGELLTMIRDKKIGWEMEHILHALMNESSYRPQCETATFKAHFSYEKMGEKWMNILSSSNL